MAYQAVENLLTKIPWMEVQQNASCVGEACAKPVFEWMQSTFGYLIIGLKNMKWEDLPIGVKQWIMDHPTATAFQLVMLFIMLVPGLAVGPLLAYLGFSNIGPVAGKPYEILRHDAVD